MWAAQLKPTLAIPTNNNLPFYAAMTQIFNSLSLPCDLAMAYAMASTQTMQAVVKSCMKQIAMRFGNGLRHQFCNTKGEM